MLQIANISSLASVYHKPPESFVKGGKTFVFKSAGDKKVCGAAVVMLCLADHLCMRLAEMPLEGL